MAITFVAPKAQRNTFFWIISLGVVLLLSGISLVVFLPGFFQGQGSVNVVPFVGSDISVNLSILDSAKVKNLEAFGDLDISFAYVVTDAQGTQVSGVISAPTRELARQNLEQGGFKVVSISDLVPLKSNPFAPY
jgi:hypothetical protein